MKINLYLASCSLLFTSCLALPPPDSLFTSHTTAPEFSLSETTTELQIWFPYIGQGDATLLKLPNGKNLLIDAGPPGAGKTYLLPFLENLEIRSLDAIVLSHYDADHLGGIPEILLGSDGIADTADDVQVHAIYDRGSEAWDPGPAYANYLLALEEAAIPRHTLAAGDQLILDAELRIRCVTANGVVDTGDQEPITVDFSPTTYTGKENAASLALLIEYGDFRYLSAGDLTGGGVSNGFLTPDVETPLAQALGKVDALHVNHHGSASSSNPQFINLISPKMAFIQAGIDNPYGHPNNEVLQRWEGSGSKIYSTAEGEGFVLSVDRNGMRVEAILEER